MKKYFCLAILLLLAACGRTPSAAPPLSPTAAPPSPQRTALPLEESPTPVAPTPPPPPSARPSPSPAPTPAPVEEVWGLAFVSDRGGQVDLWWVDPEGRELLRLTDDAAEERWPTLAWPSQGAAPPDQPLTAPWLAYVAVDEGRYSLRLLDLAVLPERRSPRLVPGSESVQLLDGPAWLGQDVLLYAVQVSMNERAFFRAGLEQEAVPLEVVGLPDGAVPMDWSVSIQGTLVLQVGRPGESSELYTARLERGRLLLEESLGEGYGPQLSPNGRWLAYLYPAYSDDPAGYLLDLETGRAFSYNEDEPLRRWDHDLGWDGAELLAFTRSSWAWTDGETGRPFYVGSQPEPSASGGAEGLYGLEVAEGQPFQLTEVGYDTAPAWSWDGRWLAFVGNRDDFGRSDIWLLDRETGQSRALTGVEGNDWAPLWVPLRVGGR